MTTNNSNSRNNLIIPSKFYQICRLCLAMCNDNDANRLSIFNNNEILCNSNHKTQSGRSLQTSIIKLTKQQKCNDNIFVEEKDTTNNIQQHHHHQQHHNSNSSSNSSYDDDSDMDITNRILTCLSIEVSQE